MPSTKKPSRTSKEILQGCVNRGAMTEYEKCKLEKQLYDNQHKGKGCNFDLVSKIYESALKQELSPKKVRFDKQGNAYEVDEVGDQRINLMYLHDIYTMEKPYINNAESVRKAVDNFLSISLKYNQPLSVNGLAISLGVSRSTLKSWHEGRSRIMNKDIIDEVFSLIDAQTELSIRQGKGNVVGQIFLAKNDSGYVDEQKISIKEDKIDDLSEDELKTKYADIIDAK